MGLKYNSGHFRGTNGNKIEPLENSSKEAKMPKNISQENHIMRDAPGHLPNTTENKQLLVNLANDKKSFLGVDENGVEWYAREENGKQYWVSVRNGIIQNGGCNQEPVEFISGRGLKKVKIIRRKKDGK